MHLGLQLVGRASVRLRLDQVARDAVREPPCAIGGRCAVGRDVRQPPVGVVGVIPGRRVVAVFSGHELISRVVGVGGRDQLPGQGLGARERVARGVERITEGVAGAVRRARQPVEWVIRIRDGRDRERPDFVRAHVTQRAAVVVAVHRAAIAVLMS